MFKITFKTLEPTLKNKIYALETPERSQNLSSSIYETKVAKENGLVQGKIKMFCKSLKILNLNF